MSHISTIRSIFIIFMIMLSTSTYAIDAKSVLDKTAAQLNSKGGITATYTLNSEKLGKSNGTIAVKGNKFHATSHQAIIWFDGKTQWTYMKKNEEVNVSNPTGAQLQALNPYNFINLYKKGYSYTLKTTGNSYEVHLTPSNSNNQIEEMYITVSHQFVLQQVRMKQKGKWTTISVSNLKPAKLSDSSFRFNAKDYPKAEVIDLR